MEIQNLLDLGCLFPFSIGLFSRTARAVNIECNNGRFLSSSIFPSSVVVFSLADEIIILLSRIMNCISIFGARSDSNIPIPEPSGMTPVMSLFTKELSWGSPYRSP